MVTICNQPITYCNQLHLLSANIGQLNIMHAGYPSYYFLVKNKHELSLAILIITGTIVPHIFYSITCLHMSSHLTIFQDRNIRRHRDEQAEKWYFSVVDIVGIASESKDARKYRNKLKQRLSEEQSEVVTNCHQLKMLAPDGKMRETDAADVETILRLIQSIPSPNAEPLKLWLAKVGYERMQETVDPAMSIDRARENRKKHGRSEKRIQQRMTGQETRNKLTDYRKDHEVKPGEEFGILTNIIHEERTDLTVKDHKKLK